jgi:hypothetical protein
MDNHLDVYCDDFLMSVMPYGVNLVFRRTPLPTEEKGPTRTGVNTPQPQVQAVVRTSVSHAKAIAEMILKAVDEWEAKIREGESKAK